MPLFKPNLVRNECFSGRVNFVDPSVNAGTNFFSTRDTGPRHTFSIFLSRKNEAACNIFKGGFGLCFIGQRLILYGKPARFSAAVVSKSGGTRSSPSSK
jgi:hypothetical protein